MKDYFAPDFFFIPPRSIFYLNKNKIVGNQKILSFPLSLLIMLFYMGDCYFFYFQELNKDVNNRDDFSIMAFDSASVTDLLVEFSQTSASRVAIGYILMVKISVLGLKSMLPGSFYLNGHTLGFHP